MIWTILVYLLAGNAVTVYKIRHGMFDAHPAFLGLSVVLWPLWGVYMLLCLLGRVSDWASDL